MYTWDGKIREVMRGGFGRERLWSTWIIRECTAIKTNCIEMNAGFICSNMLVPVESSNCVPSCVSVLTRRWNNTRLVNIPKPLPRHPHPIYIHTYHSCGEWLASDSVCASIKVTLKFPVVFYGGETWSLTLSESHWLEVLENWVLRKPFGSTREDETGGCRKMHNADIYNLQV